MGFHRYVREGKQNALTVRAVALAALAFAATAQASPRDAKPQILTPAPKAGKTTLFAQSNNDTVANVYVNGVAPSCRDGGINISQWFSNKYSTNGQDVVLNGWNLGDFTGFYSSPIASTQVGLTNAQYGGTGIQVQGGHHGWQIETTTAAPANVGPNFIAGIIGSAEFCDGQGNFVNYKPFANPGVILDFSLSLRVPHSNSMWGTVNTAAQMMYFTDPTVPPAGLGFWYSFADFTSVDQSEQVIYDEGTSSAIVGAITGKAGQFSSAIGGNQMRRYTWNSDQPFHASMTAINLRNAIDALKAAAAQHPDTLSKYLALSNDPSVYIIGGGILDTEVARVAGHDGSMGLSAQGYDLSLYSGSGVGCSPWGTQLAYSCGGPQPNADWVNVGGGCYQYDSGQTCAKPRITGNVDSVVANGSGGTTVSGWACAIGVSDALGVQVYSGTTQPQTAIGGGAAWDQGSGPLGANCMDPNNGPHRFTITLDANTTNQYRGQKVYVFGIYGQQTGLVSQSGAFVIP